ncbi:MAG: hypothetical protein Tsb0034_30370 [Ekhidna sp.]
MKKLIVTLITAIFVFGASASNGKAEQAKVTNYKEVLSKIEYPQVCKEKGIEGKVIVNLVIDENGNITSHEFVAFPCTDLRDAVKTSLSQLQFIPARDENGVAVKGKFTLPVNFKLTI